MATGNTQQIINYGATANDGTGDPLRTAFIKTDENFDNVWLAGPAGSNVRITNNTISALDTNGNLILKPNGTGVVQSNASIIPNSTNTRDLGTANLRWRSAAIGTGGLTVDGNVTVTGNLSAGNISYTGNVFVGDLRGSVYADDSTIMVDAVDNAMFADSATFGQANVLGNISANYFVGNGSQLTGIASTYGNANVASYLATYTGNISAGNINIGTGTLSYNSGLNAISITDGLEIVGTGSNYWRFNDSTDTLAFPSGASWSSDPATGDDFINSAQDGYLTFTTYDASLNEAVLLKLYHGFAQISVENGVNYDWTFDDTGKLTVAGDIVPSANNVGNLGASDRQWNSLWVANNTIYIGGVPLGVTGNVLTVNGEPVLSNDSDSTITTTGNITANYFIGDGSLLTGVASTGNITFTDTTISAPDDESMTLQVRDSEQLVRSSLVLDSDYGATRLASFSAQEEASYNILDWSTATWTGNSLDFVDAPDIAAFASDVYGDALNREFSINGGTRLPYDGFGRDGNNISFATTVAADPDPTTVTTIEFFYQYQSRIQMDYDSDDLLIEARDMDITIDGDDDIFVQAADNIDIEAGGSIDIDADEQIDIRSYSITDSVRIITDASTGTTIWAFGADGTLTTPGDIVVAGDVTGTVGANTLVLKAQPASNTSIQLNSIVDSVISTVANLEIRTDVSDTARTWEFDTTGNLVVPGNINFGGDACAAPSLNDFSSVTAAGDFDVVTGTGGTARTFEFGADGRLILPESSEANVAKFTSPPNDANVSLQLYSGNAVRIVSNTVGEPFVWTFGTTGNLTAPGAISTTGNITCGNIILTNNFTVPSNFEIVANNSVLIEFNDDDSNTSSFFAQFGEIYLNVLEDGASTDFRISNSNVTISDGLGGASELIVIGNVSAGNFIVSESLVGSDASPQPTISGFSTISATGNISGGNLIATNGVYANIDFVAGDRANASAIKTRIVSDTDFSYIQTGNGTVGSTGNIVFSPYSDPTQRVVIDTSTGNLTAQNFIGNTAGFALGYRDIPQVAFTGNATIAAADAGKHFYSTESTNYVLTIADNSAVSWPVGTAITVVNRGTGNITVAQAAGVSLYLAGNSSAGNRTVSTYGMATILNVAANVWMINGTGVI